MKALTDNELRNALPVALADGLARTQISKPKIYTYVFSLELKKIKLHFYLYKPVS